MASLFLFLLVPVDLGLTLDNEAPRRVSPKLLLPVVRAERAPSHSQVRPALMVPTSLFDLDFPV